MTVAGANMWHAVRFYKAYLPPVEAVRTLRYVVLALDDESDAYSRDCMGDGAFGDSADVSPCTPPKEMGLELLDDPLSLGPREMEIRSQSSAEGSTTKGMHQKIRFFMFKKDDISPPQLKQMLGKVRYCFHLCGRSLRGEACGCHKAHLLDPKAWRLELSPFNYHTFCLSHNNSIHCVNTEQISPTAGFLFACGLLHENVVEAVQPVLCRYSVRCRYGARCLYVHANITPRELVNMTASTPLKAQLRAESDLPIFLTQLDEIGLHTVGDVQQLSDNAFDAIVGRSEPRWLTQWLNIAIVREIQPKLMLESVLATFPDVVMPVSLPLCLTSVSSLIQLSSREFYALALPIKVQAACEQIRARFEPDRNYNIVDLKKEMEGSFFLHVTQLIVGFRHDNAHPSWRKKDPMRPIVTSLITYVDPKDCECRTDASEHTRPPSVRGSGGCHSDLKYPTKSWCKCPRSFVVALNYELSTPSGSRCSEQNALGKLASIGLPTSAVREVFVHGENKGSNKDPNPLFPCGVCENMLLKVARDVYGEHGGDVMLYMFDSTTNPKKLVCLPITEISHRDGRSFKKFISDMREE
ncbi:hypothetical protein DQ04_00351040 [Trypanosoma grayi]|uniref:hypothetical protein n=1 Tax=Trypanosoma grayi TaxID=71804 RepID=UPI0004F411A5|nr:hypothetical protein DQ04_00351040 [Trypanosoma grayi]KEG14667.1 hypothetical protein DQ04_00351040 [Trypanosoma grayi]